ncbi:MAG: hypothetical protein ABW198_00150 [Pseudorhodoplanes sp.]
MPLQNRVDPFGEILAVTARGSYFGNRGGRIHRDDRTLGRRRFASKQWICCLLEFKNRRREVMGAGYTELFFLDEVTALAAGHRPCFECRRRDAIAFAESWARPRPSAPEMDAVLHAQRIDGRIKRLHRLPLDDLPDGAMIALDGAAFAVRGKQLIQWSPSGYARELPRQSGSAFVLTPPAILDVLRAGYPPQWHDSAGGSGRLQTR